jgi:hypothetical protein
MRFFVVIIVVVSACRAFAATPGIYYCVTDYMAGVQRDSEKPNNPPFVGIITPDAPRQKFVVKVVHWDSLPPERRKSEQDELRNFALTKCSYLAEIPGVFPSQRLVSPGLPAAPPSGCTMHERGWNLLHRQLRRVVLVSRRRAFPGDFLKSRQQLRLPGSLHCFLECCTRQFRRPTRVPDVLLAQLRNGGRSPRRRERKSAIGRDDEICWWRSQRTRHSTGRVRPSHRWS